MACFPQQSLDGCWSAHTGLRTQPGPKWAPEAWPGHRKHYRTTQSMLELRRCIGCVCTSSSEFLDMLEPPYTGWLEIKGPPHCHPRLTRGAGHEKLRPTRYCEVSLAKNKPKMGIRLETKTHSVVSRGAAAPRTPRNPGAAAPTSARGVPQGRGWVRKRGSPQLKYKKGRQTSNVADKGTQRARCARAPLTASPTWRPTLPCEPRNPVIWEIN